MTRGSSARCHDVINFAETDPAQDEGVYTLHLTREEGLDVLRALDDWNGPTAASVRAMQRLAARLYPET
ncbi:hypothetical protein ACFWMX_14530 [Streptomyces sp. NPDC058378]|uniref:hypothetical protein n=1 Tax=Streptomyces sp. NPDC058378 TaxID=3346469 RepID=UPI0036686653